MTTVDARACRPIIPRSPWVLTRCSAATWAAAARMPAWGPAPGWTGRETGASPGLHTSTDFPVTPDAFQTANAGGFDVFLAKVALDKPYKGSGQRPGPVTAGSSGPREGLTRDRIAGQ
jgi:hypothetical protein